MKRYNKNFQRSTIALLAILFLPSLDDKWYFHACKILLIRISPSKDLAKDTSLGKLSPYPHLSFRAVQSPRISANFFVTSVCPFSVFFLPHFFVLMIFFVSPASLCFLLPHARLLAFSLPRRLDLAVFLPRRTSVSLPPWNLLQSRVLDGLVPF